MKETVPKVQYMGISTYLHDIPVQNFNQDLANLGEILGENLATKILAKVRISAAKFSLR